MKIILATDGSIYSETAAMFLTRLGWSQIDDIIVFHAVYWIPFRYDAEFYFSTLKEIKKEIAPRILDSMLEILKPVHAKISVAIEEGAPERGIVDVAVDSGADLITMGARGIKGIESILIGSVTRSVAINSPKPVLVVKQPGSALSSKIKILFATDGSDYSQVTGESLSSLPFPESTEVTILHVIWSNFLDIPERFVVEINERIKGTVADTRAKEIAESEIIIDKARGYLNKRFKNIHGLTRVGDPSAEILKIAEAERADIIAVGCRGLRGIKGMMGSVSRNILVHSKSSVFIGKTSKG
jgi:nucleotide-binding universal stress UspA family protein